MTKNESHELIDSLTMVFTQLSIDLGAKIAHDQKLLCSVTVFLYQQNSKRIFQKKVQQANGSYLEQFYPMSW